MEKDSEFRELIYDLVSGNLTLSEPSIPESEIVKNEFEEGSECANAYGRMLEAYTRLCERLGSPEWNDRDVEAVINELLSIGRHIALKMFDYGLYFGKKNA